MANGLLAAPREGGGTVSLRPLGENALVAHDAGGLQQMDGIEVENTFGLRLIAHAGVVAGQAEHVAHAESRRAEQVALDGDAVAVAAGDLVTGS